MECIYNQHNFITPPNQKKTCFHLRFSLRSFNLLGQWRNFLHFLGITCLVGKNKVQTALFQGPIRSVSWLQQKVSRKKLWGYTLRRSNAQMQLPQFSIDLLLLVLGGKKTTYSQMLTKKIWWWIPWQKGKKQTPKKNSSKSKILECLECFADFFKEPAWWKFTPNSPRNKKNRLPPPPKHTPWNTTHETSSPPVVSFHTLVKNCTTSKSWKRHPVAWDVPLDGRPGPWMGGNEWLLGSMGW